MRRPPTSRPRRPTPSSRHAKTQLPASRLARQAEPCRASSRPIPGDPRAASLRQADRHRRPARQPVRGGLHSCLICAQPRARPILLSAAPIRRSGVWSHRSLVTHCSFSVHWLTREHSLWATSERPPGAAGEAETVALLLAWVSRTDGQRAYGCSGCYRCSRRVCPTRARWACRRLDGLGDREASHSGII
jgi:hypothetical protein